MNALNIGEIHKQGGLSLGAKLLLRGSRPAALGPQANDIILEAGVSSVRVGVQEIEWVEQQIIAKNPPRSWGDDPYRWRPKWKCPVCERGAYVLHLRADGLFVCAACSGYQPESRTDRMSGDLRRLARLRKLLKVSGIFDDPNVSRPPKGKPNSIAQWKRRVRDLRLLEQKIASRLEGEAFARFVGREKPSI